MTSRIASRRLALLPLHIEEKRAPAAAHRANDAPSSSEVVARVVFGAMLMFVGLTLIALAPTSIAALTILAGVSGAVALVGRHRDAAPRAAPRPKLV